MNADTSFRDFPQDMEYYLENVGFEVLKISHFWILMSVSKNYWGMTIIAKAVRKEE
jgi:hypothetical protein